MIQGEVNAAYEAVVTLPLQDPEGRTRDIEAVVDTGYSGFLTLPTGLVDELNQYQGGMCISGVLKTTERTLQHFISPSGPNWVTTESAVSDMYISPWL